MLSRTVWSCVVWLGLWEETREPRQSWDLPMHSHFTKLVGLRTKRKETCFLDSFFCTTCQEIWYKQETLLVIQFVG